MTKPVPGESFPPAAAVLGVAGLAPFLGLAALALLAPSLREATLGALLRYGAVILTFVGALHWAYAVRRAAHGSSAWIQYGWSVVPALVAWATLFLPIPAGLRAQAAALVVCLWIDHAMARVVPVPAWLLRLRILLTAVAAGTLALASLA